MTKLFPLAGTMPKAMRDAPNELTRVVAKSFSAELAPTPIEDAAELIGCSVEQQACLASITEKVGATTIMFGRIERRDDGVVVKLTSYDPRKGEPQQRSFTISGTTTDELAEALVEKIENATRAKVPPPDGKDTKTEDNGTPLDVTSVKDEPSGKITTGTWGLIIGGGVGVGVGVGFLFAANNLKDDILKAPTQSGAEIRRLEGLERAARTRLYIGTGLTLVGGAIATVGIVRAVIQKKKPSQEQPLVDVVPENGGASVFLNLRWP